MIIKLQDFINEIRNQLEIPFNGGDGQNDKPAHIHFLDLIEDSKIKNVNDLYSTLDPLTEIDKAIKDNNINTIDLDGSTLIYQVIYSLNLTDNLELLSDDVKDDKDLTDSEELYNIIGEYGINAFSEEGKEELSNKLYEIIYTIIEENGLTYSVSDSYNNNDDGLIDIWRMIDINKPMTQHDLYLELQAGYENKFGVYWAYAEKYAEAYLGKGVGTIVLLHGQVRAEDVDWSQTVDLNYGDLMQEHEIRLKKDIVFKLLDVTFNDKVIHEFENTYLKA